MDWRQLLRGEYQPGEPIPKTTQNTQKDRPSRVFGDIGDIGYGTQTLKTATTPTPAPPEPRFNCWRVTRRGGEVLTVISARMTLDRARRYFLTDWPRPFADAVEVEPAGGGGHG